MTPRDVAGMGQVFTPPAMVDYMLSLRRNRGRTLEPSCGDGAFSDRLVAEGTETVAIELDRAHAPAYARVTDFFALPRTERFATIIGNPPYIRIQDVRPGTRGLLDMSLLDGRSNLYLFFVQRCVEMLEDGGELIFVVPRDILKLTSAARLNAWLYAQGTMTDVVETGDEPIFGGAMPNCLVFRFEKGNFSRRTDGVFFGTERKGLRFVERQGGLLFLDAEYTVPFSDLFYVKVGGTSAADDVFEHPDGNVEVVFSRTRATGEHRRMFYNVAAPQLLPHKDRLLARRIRRFGEDNWWQWGRNFYESDAPRIYVNFRTRVEDPFFIDQTGCLHWDGTVFGIFPKDPGMNLEKACGMLNEVDWQELGFRCDGRYLFGQGSLERTLLPESFRSLLPTPTSR